MCVKTASCDRFVRSVEVNVKRGADLADVLRRFLEA